MARPLLFQAPQQAITDPHTGLITRPWFMWFNELISQFTTVGDLAGPTSAVANQIALFDGTTGLLVKAATGAGAVVALTSGVYSTQVPANDNDVLGNTAGVIAFRYPNLLSAEGLCTADTALGAGYTDITGCTISLTAGTWFVSAVALVVNAGVIGNAFVKIYNFTDTIDYVASLQAVGAALPSTFSAQALVTVAATKSIRLAAKQSAGTMTATRFAEGTILNTYVRGLRVV